MGLDGPNRVKEDEMYGYYLMALLYFSLGIVAMAGSSLIRFDVLPAANGLRWLQVHFITLGVLTQVLFGALPELVASSAEKPKPRMRWGVWLILNAGLIALLIAIPQVNQAMLVAGGTLVLIATTLLLAQLVRLQAPDWGRASHARACGGTRFYAAGLAFLLLGAFVGTGLYLGWSQWLHLPAPKDVHVHSNLWGFAALIFAGLLVDLPVWGEHGNGSHLGGRRSTAIFLLMAAGALGMAVGPWLASTAVQSIGLVMHIIGTASLLVSLASQIRRNRTGTNRAAWSAGRLHVFAAFVWFLVISAMGPVVVFLPEAKLAQSLASQGGPLLIYGWIMGFLLAVLPYLFTRAFTPGTPALLGGNRVSLVAVNAGGLLYLSGLLLPGPRAILQGLAFAAWAVAMIPVALQLWRSVQSATEQAALEAEPVRADVAVEP
jgi:cytochrome c oxidase cbb3-type subunit I